MNGFVGLLIAKPRGISSISVYLNREIKSEQSVSMVAVHAAISLAMNTSIGPELSELTQRQAMTTGKRLSKSLRRCSIGMLLKVDFEKFVYLPRHALRVGTREFSLLRACSKIHVSGFSGMLLKAGKKVSRWASACP
jgi:hypothetical protein